jgi:hypothetical protein
MAPGIESASISVLRLYDVANAIDLAVAERSAAAAAAATRIQLTQAKRKAIAYGEPPVEIALGRAVIPGVGEAIEADVIARIFDFGTVTLALRVRADGLDWDGFVERVARVNGALEASVVWSEQLGRVTQLIGTSLDKPTQTPLEEDYLVATINRFAEPITADRILAEVDVARLLSGERQPLSKGARDELLRNTFSYFTDDLVVLTWDRAFVVEPSGDRDVADVLEVANAQLLELRYYDTLLDNELPRMYERVEQARQTFGGLARRRYAALARDIYTRVAEVTEIAERVDNALIVTEDVYLARIYGAALELFRVRAWNAAVERKLAIMRDTYSALYDEAATSRAEVLEAAIVLLIVLEIILAFVL